MLKIILALKKKCSENNLFHSVVQFRPPCTRGHHSIFTKVHILMLVLLSIGVNEVWLIWIHFSNNRRALRNCCSHIHLLFSDWRQILDKLSAFVLCRYHWHSLPKPVLGIQYHSMFGFYHCFCTNAGVTRRFCLWFKLFLDTLDLCAEVNHQWPL